MKRRDVLTMCVVALGVTGFGVALFSPQPANAKGPAEGSQPRVTAATASYQGCTVSIKLEDPKNPNGKITLEVENPTSRMVDFPVVIEWNTQGVADRWSRVAMPSTRTIEKQSIRCIAFPRSTASFDLPLPPIKAGGPTAQVQTPQPNGGSMVQLQVKMGEVVMQGPWLTPTASFAGVRKQALTNVAASRR